MHSFLNNSRRTICQTALGRSLRRQAIRNVTHHVRTTAPLVSHHHHQQQQQLFHTSHSNRLLDEKTAQKENEDKDIVDEDDIVLDEVSEEKQAEKLSKEGIIEETEQVVGQKEQKEFQTETKRLLEIVATALYKDKEVSA